MEQQSRRLWGCVNVFVKDRCEEGTRAAMGSWSCLRTVVGSGGLFVGQTGFLCSVLVAVVFFQAICELSTVREFPEYDRSLQLPCREKAARALWDDMFLFSLLFILC
jgi:hypothetical protein